MARPMTIIAPTPGPIQTMKTGPSAILGRLFKTIKMGSIILASLGIHQSSMAMAVPSTVPSKKPATVSIHVMPMC